MTERYAAWLAHLNARDAALLSVFLLACAFLTGIILTLINVDDKWRGRLRWVFTFLTAALYYATLALIW